MAREHVEISAAQKSAANKKFQELMAAEKPEEAKDTIPAEGADNQEQRADVETVTDAGEKQVNDEPVAEKEAPEKKDGEKADEKLPEEEVLAEEPPVDEADAIAAQEALLAETPPKKETKDKDKTPPEERAAFKKIRQLEKRIAELAGVQPTAEAKPREEAKPETVVTAPIISTPAEVESQIAQLDKEWNEGLHGDWDYARLEAEKVSLRAEARVMAKIKAEQKSESERIAKEKATSEQAATTERIDKAIAKTETLLPGLKEAFTTLAHDKVLGPDPIIGQAIMQNLDKGGLHVAYYLRHHTVFALGLLELPVDERAAKLYDLRLKLTRPKKTAVKPTDFKPEKPIVNSHIPEKNEKDKNKSSDSDVEAEIAKARRSRR